MPSSAASGNGVTDTEPVAERYPDLASLLAAGDDTDGQEKSDARVRSFVV